VEVGGQISPSFPPSFTSSHPLPSLLFSFSPSLPPSLPHHQVVEGVDGGQKGVQVRPLHDAGSLGHRQAGGRGREGGGREGVTKGGREGGREGGVRLYGKQLVRVADKGDGEEGARWEEPE